MKIKSIFLYVMLCFFSISCVSTKSTLKNVDNNAPDLKLTKNNTFIITQYSTDEKYGFNPSYPINVFYKNTKDETINQQRFFNALTGPNGEKITYIKIESCCPFPTKNNDAGAGFLDVFEVSWQGLKKPLKMYVNIYEKSVLMVPVGFKLKQ